MKRRDANGVHHKIFLDFAIREQALRLPCKGVQTGLIRTGGCSDTNMVHDILGCKNQKWPARICCHHWISKDHLCSRTLFRKFHSLAASCAPQFALDGRTMSVRGA